MTNQKIIDELKQRGLMCGASDKEAEECADKARIEIAKYCKLSESEPLPDGLFYGWLTLTGAIISLRSGGVVDCTHPNT